MEGVYKRADGMYPEWAEWRSSDPDGAEDENCVVWEAATNAFRDTDCTADQPFMCEYYIG